MRGGLRLLIVSVALVAGLASVARGASASAAGPSATSRRTDTFPFTLPAGYRGSVVVGSVLAANGPLEVTLAYGGDYIVLACVGTAWACRPMGGRPTTVSFDIPGDFLSGRIQAKVYFNDYYPQPPGDVHGTVSFTYNPLPPPTTASFPFTLPAGSQASVRVGPVSAGDGPFYVTLDFTGDFVILACVGGPQYCRPMGGRPGSVEFHIPEDFPAGPVTANVYFNYNYPQPPGDASGSVTFAYYPLPPSLQVHDASVMEGDTGSTPEVIVVTLSAPAAEVVSVDYSTTGGTALAGADFIGPSGTLGFPPGVTSRTISVPVLGDRLREGDETFQVALSNPQRATIGRSPGIGTIVDDDPVGFAIGDAAAVEPPSSSLGEATLTVSLSPASATAVSVSYDTVDGTATSASDYVTTSGTLDFAPYETARTIAVPIKATNGSQVPRSFHVDLSASSGPPIGRARGTVTIYDAGFYSVAPCRLLDTREAAQGPALSYGSSRVVGVAGRCGIPTSAAAVSLNLTVVSASDAGDLRLFPSNVGLPLVSAVNYGVGQTRANNAVVPLSPEGRLTVMCEQAAGFADLILDVNGYFE